MKKISVFIIILLSGMLFSCDDKEVCTEVATAYLQAGFYKAIEGEEQDSVLNNVTVYGAGVADPLMNKVNNVKQLLLPLDFDAQASSFIITNDSITDTLFVSYDTTLTFVSFECGFAPNYDLDDAQCSKNGFDSLKIVKKLVDTENEENIKIYL